MNEDLTPRLKDWRDHFMVNGSCWEWTGYRDRAGYGRIYGTKDGHVVTTGAHRFVYRQVKGEIPEGLDLDHLCRNPACVNPEHLEPVTRKVNLNRGEHGNGKKTHCPKGHEYTPENTYLYGPNKTWRQCRTCYREMDKKRQPRRSVERKLARAQARQLKETA